MGFNLEELENKYLQDKFIAQLQLPTYDNFSKYQFVDVLDALSLRLMIMDHTLKYKLSKRGSEGKDGDEIKDQDDEDDSNDGSMNTEEQYEEIKAMIKEDISKLMIHQEADDIMAVKEVKAQEQKLLNPVLNKKDEELTSMHQAAAEVAISRMRKFIYLKRKYKGVVAASLS